MRKKETRKKETRKKGMLWLGLFAWLGFALLLPTNVRAEEVGGTEGETRIEISDGYDSQTIAPNAYGNTTQTVFG